MLIELTHSSRNCENTDTLCYYHHQIGLMVHLPLLRVRSWNNGMRCMNFYILTRLWYLKSISYKDTAFQERLVFGKSWNVTWFQLKVYKMFAKWALVLNKGVWEYCLLIVMFWTDSWFLWQYNVQYQRMVFHADFGCTWATLLLWWLSLKWWQAAE